MNFFKSPQLSPTLYTMHPDDHPEVREMRRRRASLDAQMGGPVNSSDYSPFVGPPDHRYFRADRSARQAQLAFLANKKREQRAAEKLERWLDGMEDPEMVHLLHYRGTTVLLPVTGSLR